MSQVLSRLRDGLSRPHTRLILGVAVFVFAFFLVGDSALAVEETSFFSNPIDWTMELVGQLALQVGSWILMLVVAMLDVLIELLTYNGFGTSQVVAVGWAVVRDVVNLFFVVVLIIIAFGTILGVSRFNWIQQVPRLLIFAIVINFSKTLASLMIDVGQVIMLTFANALKDIAAGNFIQLFGINGIFDLSTTSGPVVEVTTPGAQGIQGFDLFAAGLAALALAIWIGIVVFVLLLIMALRIVMLWVLIIVAPLAWFIGGIKDLVHSSAYDQWWAKFTCWVAVGPVLTFFLWLALAVAGSGNIAVTEGMASADGAGASNLILSIFESHRFMSFVLGMAMIMAGFEAAQEVCHGASGFISDALKKGESSAIRGIGGYAAGKALKRGAAWTGKAPFRAGWGLTKMGAAVAGAGIATRMAKKDGLRWLTKGGRAAAARERAQKTGSPAMAGIYGKIADSAQKGQLEHMQHDVAGFETSASKMDYLRAFNKKAEKAQKGGKIAKALGPTALQQHRATALLQQVMGDDKAIGELDKTGDLKKLWDAVGGEHMKADFAGNPEMTKKIEDFEVKNPHITGKTGSIDSWDKVKNLSDNAIKHFGRSEKLREQLAGIKTDRKGQNNEYLYADEALSQGLGVSNKKRDLFNAGQSGLQNLSKDELSALSDDEIASSISVYEAADSSKAVRALRGNPGHDLNADVHRELLRSGLGIEDDQILDANVFKANFTPAMLGNIRPETFRDNEEAAKLAAQSMDDTAMTSVIAQLKKNPKSDAAIRMHENMTIILKKGGNEGMKKTFTAKLKKEFSDTKDIFDSEKAGAASKIDTSIRQVYSTIDQAIRDAESKSGDMDNSANDAEQNAEQVLESIDLFMSRVPRTNIKERGRWKKQKNQINQRLALLHQALAEARGGGAAEAEEPEVEDADSDEGDGGHGGHH